MIHLHTQLNLERRFRQRQSSTIACPSAAAQSDRLHQSDQRRAGAIRCSHGNDIADTDLDDAQVQDCRCSKAWAGHRSKGGFVASPCHCAVVARLICSCKYLPLRRQGEIAASIMAALSPTFRLFRTGTGSVLPSRSPA